MGAWIAKMADYFMGESGETFSRKAFLILKKFIVDLQKGLYLFRAAFPKVGSTEPWGFIKESKGFQELLSSILVFSVL